MRDRLHTEGQLGLFPLANPDLLGRKVLKAGLADRDYVIFWLKIWNPQLTTLRGSLLHLSIEKDSRFVLARDNNESADVLARHQESCKRGSRAYIDVQLVLIVAVNQGQFMSTSRNLWEFPSILWHGGRRLPVKAKLGRGITGVHVDLAAEIADHNGQETVGSDPPPDRRHRSRFA